MNKSPLSNFQNRFPQLAHKMAAERLNKDLWKRGSLFSGLLSHFSAKLVFNGITRLSYASRRFRVLSQDKDEPTQTVLQTWRSELESRFILQLAF